MEYKDYGVLSGGVPSIGGAGLLAASYGTGRQASVLAKDIEPTNNQIREGVGYLERQIAETHAVISALESRLETVLTPVAPQPPGTGEKTGPGTPTSELFIRLKSVSHGLQDVQDRMHRLLSRIEV